MRKQLGLTIGLFTMALFVIVSGCETVPPGSNGNTNTNDNTNMNGNTNDNSGDDNMNDNTGDDNMNDNTSNDNMNDNGGNDNTNDNMNDNGGGGTGDATAGMAFYEGNGCAGCHAADATGGIGPPLAGVDATEFLEHLDGTESHPVTVDGVTAQDAENLVAFVASLQ